MSRVLLNNYGEENLDMICRSTSGGRKLLAEERGEPFEEETTDLSNFSVPTMTESRRAQTCGMASAVYPGDPTVDTDGVFTRYAEENYNEYFLGGNLNTRSNVAIVIENLKNEIKTLYGVATGLSACSNVWSTVNSIIGVADIPTVDLEMASEAINRFTCGLASEYNDIVISRKERDLERLEFHDQLIVSAEVKASHENSVAMLEDLCETSSEMTLMEGEMETIAYAV